MSPHRFGQTEVGDLGRAVAGHQNVGRLQIAMDDPPAMGLGDGARQDLDQRGGPFGRPGRAVEPLRQAPPFKILELEIRPLVVVAEAVDLDDIGMAQLRDRLGLGKEANRSLVTGVLARQDHLERDHAVELDLASPVYDSHAAATQHGFNFIAGDRRRHPGRRSPDSAPAGSRDSRVRGVALPTSDESG